MIKTKIYAYRGCVCIEGGDEFIVPPNSPGQLGVIADVSTIEITDEALNLLKSVGRSGSSLGDVMCFEAADDKKIFGWMGGERMAFLPENVRGDRDYNPGILQSQVVSDIKANDEVIMIIDKAFYDQEINPGADEES